jgi:tRNA (guanine-N7-)-methyltransferase
MRESVETAGLPDARPQVRGVHGRRRGKKLRAMHTQLVDSLLPRLLVDVSNPLENRIGNHDVWLEIGFGGGEHLASQAQANPLVHFIGCEPFINGVAKLLAEVASANLDNVRIHPDDALAVLQSLPAKSIARIYLLFPDPWPKQRQKKRRFISNENLAQLARVMNDGAELRFATDVDDYCGWALSHFLQSADFEWRAEQASDWSEPWESHKQTRYEQKAIRKGDKPVYLTFVRVSGAAPA